MKQLIFLFILYFSFHHNAYAQPLQFRDVAVIRISMESITGFYHFDRKASIGKRDALEISYDTSGRQYVAGSFTKGTYYAPSDKNEVPFKNEMEMPGFMPLPVENKLLEKLFIELNNQVPPDSLGMDAAVLRSLVNDSSVMLIANRLNLTLKLNEIYPQREKLVKELLTAGRFNSFLKSHLDTTCIYNMNADYWDRILITVVTTKRLYRFEGNTKQNFRQAWFEFADTAGEKVNRCLLNPGINEAVLPLLPVKFISRYFLERREMTDAYMEWYLRERLR